MKIVILVSYTYPYIGSGIGQVALTQAEGLAKLGHEVVLVSGNVPESKYKFTKDDVLHIKLNSNNLLDRFGIPVPFFVFSKDVVKHIKETDIVHCHEMLYPYSIQSAILAKFYKKPFILTQHAGFIVYPNPLINMLQTLVKKTFGKTVLKMSDKVIVVNDDVKKWLGVNGNKVLTMLNGVDNKLFFPVSKKRKTTIRKRYNLPLQKNIVLHVGRLVEKKGYKKLYDIRNNDYLILIVGGGSVPQKMKNDEKKIRFLGALPQDQLSEIYQASDIFVLPSDCEGFPLSIQEAMACGLPVVTSDHPGFEKYLDKHYVKFINPTNGEVKSAIEQVLNNRKLQKEMSNYSVNSGIVKNAWDKNIIKLVNIYEQVR